MASITLDALFNECVKFSKKFNRQCIYSSDSTVCLATSEGKNTSRWRPAVVLGSCDPSLSETVVEGIRTTSRRDGVSVTVLVRDLNPFVRRVDGQLDEFVLHVASPRRGRMMSDSDDSEVLFG